MGSAGAHHGLSAEASAKADSDADLMRRTAAGDREAFAVIYRRHHATIFRFARLMTGSNSLAEDVVQEVFLAVMSDAGRFVPERALLSTYLYGIARRLTRRRLVRERRFVGLEIEDGRERDELSAPPTVADDVMKECELRRLRRAILALPSRYREVIVLCDLQNVPYADAAVTLGCALGTVRSRLHRGRQLLTDKLLRADAARADTTAGAATRMRCAV